MNQPLHLLSEPRLFLQIHSSESTQFRPGWLHWSGQILTHPTRLNWFWDDQKSTQNGLTHLEGNPLTPTLHLINLQTPFSHGNNVILLDLIRFSPIKRSVMASLFVVVFSSDRWHLEDPSWVQWLGSLTFLQAMKKAILEGLPQPDLLRGTFQSTISTMGQPGSVYPTQLGVQVQTLWPWCGFSFGENRRFGGRRLLGAESSNRGRLVGVGGWWVVGVVTRSWLQ